MKDDIFKKMEIIPNLFGVFIPADKDEDCIDKYGFRTRAEAIDFIKEKANFDDDCVLYTYTIQTGQPVICPLYCGDREDFGGEDFTEEEEE